MLSQFKVRKKNFGAIGVKNFLCYFNSLLDVLIKIAPIWIALSAVLLLMYLNVIGMKYLFVQSLNSIGGLIALILSFGLVSLAFIFFLVITPAAGIYSVKLYLKENVNFDIKIMELIPVVVAPTALLWIGMLVNKGRNLFIAVTLPWVISGIYTFFLGRRYLVDCPTKFIFCLSLGFASFGLFYPSFVVVEILSSLKVDDDFSVFSIFSFVLLYGSIASVMMKFFIVDYKKTLNIKNTLIKSMLFIFLFFVMVFPFSSNLFVPAAMELVGVRQTDKDAQWYAVDSKLFSKIVVDETVWKVDRCGGELYVHGYFPFNFGDVRVLCSQTVPSNIRDFRPSLCAVFDKAEIRSAMKIEKCKVDESHL